MQIRILSFLSLTALSLTLFSCGNDAPKEETKAPVKTNLNQKLFKFLTPEETGINFRNDFTFDTELLFYKYQYNFNGSGVAIGDINNDGLEDVYFGGSEVANKLYLNKGNLKFEDITASAGVGNDSSWTSGVTMADVNADGWLDIYVSCSGYRDGPNRKNKLYINQQNNSFKEQAEQFGIADSGFSTQAVFFDYDLDGDLDLYVLNHGNEWSSVSLIKRASGDRPIQADILYRNNGDGSFKNVSKEAGLGYEMLGGWGLGIAVGDLNGDLYPEIYISNDYDAPDYLYVNNGDGTFTEDVKGWMKHVSLFSMGNDIADVNNDGLLDIFTLDMAAEDNKRIKTMMSAMQPDRFYELVNFGLPHQYMYNALQLNQGNESFSDIAQMTGMHSTDWSWSPLFADFDNDGYKDCFISNGYRIDDRDNDYRIRMSETYGKGGSTSPKNAAEKFRQAPSTPLPNYAYKNNGDLSFSKKSYEWGVGQKGFTQGAAFADLDQDGDLDLVTNNIKDFAWVYENKANEMFEQKYVKFKLEGSPQNPDAIGAKVTLYTSDGIQFSENQPTRGYMSSNGRDLFFAVREGVELDRVEVVFPNGKALSKKLTESNQLFTLSISDAQGTYAQSKHKTYFQDATALMTHEFIHVENEFDDFATEILLPHRNSMHGPGVTVGDANGDGLDDFYVGGALAQSGALYLQSKSGSFKLSNAQPWVKEKSREDLDALFFDADNDGDQDLYVVSGGNEYPQQAAELQDRLYVNDGKGNFQVNWEALPNMSTSGKEVEAGDYDGDGDLDLFVGGRLVPGAYPFSPVSYILRNDGGKFTDVTDELAPDLRQAGLITDAEWVDIDQDEKLDLLIVGEWTSINFYMNKGTSFEILDNDLLAKQIGWWSAIHLNDFDVDGDQDIILGNLGENYKYKASFEEPFHIYCHDFDNSGNLDIVLGYYNGGTCYPVRGRTCSSQQMPFIKKKFKSYDDFGTASLADVYGDKLDKALHYAVTNFSSLYLENKGGGQFEIRKLPRMAQISSITSINSGDYDGDGNLDVVFSGNLFSAEVETTRNDASIGGMLKGNGKGDFEWVPVTQSGYFTPGDVKDVEKGKLADGSTFFVIANNDDQLKVLKN